MPCFAAVTLERSAWGRCGSADSGHPSPTSADVQSTHAELPSSCRPSDTYAPAGRSALRVLWPAWTDSPGFRPTLSAVSPILPLPDAFVWPQVCCFRGRAVGSAFGAAVAVDGKIRPVPMRWGMGLLDLDSGHGTWGGGRYADLGLLLYAHGQHLSQATAEAIALGTGARWLAGRLGLRCFASHALLVSDATSIVATMRSRGRHLSTAAPPRGFDAALALAAESLIGLAVIAGSVSICHKSTLASEAFYSPQDWPPDQLAGFGADSEISCGLARAASPCFHFLAWSNIRTDRHGLVLFATARVTDTASALSWLGFGSHASLRTDFHRGFLRRLPLQ